MLAEVRSGDVVLIPHGWHGPSMAVPGYDLYYLNVMAGPGDGAGLADLRRPAHSWIRETWADRGDRPAAAVRRPSQGAREGAMTTRLTVAQAIVRFLEAQYVERDGVENAFFAGCWGIFGHGNVAGVGQALLEREREVPTTARGEPRAPLLPGPQRAGDGARLGRLCAASRPDGDVRVHGVGRPRVDQHGHRRRARDRQPDPGPAAARRRLRHPGRQPGAAGARGPAIAGRQRQRLLQAGVALLGPDQPARAAAASLLAAMRVLTDPAETGAVTLSPAAGRAGRGVRLARTTCSHAGCGTSAGRPIEEAALARAVEVIRCGAAARSSWPAAASSTPRRPSSCAPSPRRPASRSRRPRRARARCPTTTRSRVGAIGATGTTAADALADEADVVHRRRHPLQRLHDGVPDRLRAPRRPVRQPQRRVVRRAQAVGRRPLVGDARRGLEQLTEALAGWSVPTGTPDRATELAREWDDIVAALLRPRARRRCRRSRRCSASSTGCRGPRTSWSARPARCRATCTSCGGPATRKGYHVEYGFSCMGYEIAGGLGREDGAPTTPARTATSSSWSATAPT